MVHDPGHLSSFVSLPRTTDKTETNQTYNLNQPKKEPSPFFPLRSSAAQQDSRYVKGKMEKCVVVRRKAQFETGVFSSTRCDFSPKSNRTARGRPHASSLPHESVGVSTRIGMHRRILSCEQWIGCLF